MTLLSDSSRREFLSQAALAGLISPMILGSIGEMSAASQPASVSDTKRDRKIKIGLVGGGGRGSWIAGLFQQDGGYEFHAIADYFPEVSDRVGQTLGVDKSRRFSGLSGYKRLIESGVEAVALETPPFFFPEMAMAAAEAGLHVYMAKPVAVDAWGCKRIEAASGKATGHKRAFYVDYQMPTDPSNIEVVRQIRAGAIGKLLSINSYYLGSPFGDPPLTANLESRLQNLIWVNDNAIGGSYHVNACIHAVDAAMWAAGAVPKSASGASRVARNSPHGDSADIYSITFEYADGLIHQHEGRHLANQHDTRGFCGCEIHGEKGTAGLSYSAQATLLNADTAYKEDVVNLYEAGARRSIAQFYQHVTEGRTDNPTVRHAVDSALTTILGREAARRRVYLTMERLIKENQRLEINLKGLKS